MEKKLILLVFSLFCAGIVNAAILNVPSEYFSIQTGIDAASAGDTVLVQPGTYVENIDYNGKNITVASLFLTTQDTSYIFLTRINGNQNGSVVTFKNGEDSLATLLGFTIQDGRSERGGGIYCICSSSPRLVNIIIINNSADIFGGGLYCSLSSSPILKDTKIISNDAEEGGGIFCWGHSALNIEDVYIYGNNAYHNGGGIYSSDFTSLELSNVEIIDNTAGRDGGGIYSSDFTSLELSNVEIIDNIAGRDGGGILMYHNASLMSDNIKIYHNTAEWGGGISCNDINSFVIENSQITNNIADIGGGLYSEDSAIIITDSTLIENNCSNLYGGGIYYKDSSTFLNHIIIRNNRAIKGGGLYFSSSLQNLIMDVKIIHNHSNLYGGGMFCSNSSVDLFSVNINNNKANYGGGIYCDNNTSLDFDNANRSNIFSNFIIGNKGAGADVFSLNCSPIDVIVDTFTTLTPSDYYASPIDQFTFDILNSTNGNLINSDLYVSVEGNDSNAGTSIENPLRTINHALSIIYSDSLNIHTIHIASGLYSTSTNGEIFPIICNNFVSLKGMGTRETILDAEHMAGILELHHVSHALIENMTLENGYTDNGGCIYCCKSSPNFKNIILRGNDATGDGGGINIYDSSPTFENVELLNNTSSEYGGGIYCYISSPILRNVLLTGNDAAYGGGGIYIRDSYSTLFNVTVTNNIAGLGGGILCNGNNSIEMVNSIVASNLGFYGIYIYDDHPVIRYSNFWNNENGEFFGGNDSIGVNVTTNANGDSCDVFYNIKLDPLFVDSANNDYHLRWANYPISDSTKSPCIDAGDPNSPIDPDGTIADMGVYYFNQGVSIDIPGNNPEDIISNFPNPAKNSTAIKYSLKKNSSVKISIYNIIGQLISILINEDKPKGEHSVIYNTEKLNSGVYFYKIETGDVTEIKKMVVIK